MAEESETRGQSGTTRVVVEAGTLEGVVEAIGADGVGAAAEDVDCPEYLGPVVDTLGAVYDGVRRATEDDNRGRSRKIVRRYADREDLSGDAVGHHLRVLEAHDLVVREGNRWRLPESGSG